MQRASELGQCTAENELRALTNTSQIAQCIACNSHKRTQITKTRILVYTCMYVHMQYACTPAAKMHKNDACMHRLMRDTPPHRRI